MGNSGYRVAFTRQGAKDLAKLKKRNRLAYDRALAILRELETDHEAGHALRGSLSGCRSLEFSVKGSGEYRAVYVSADAETVCVVFLVATHENVYDVAARRAGHVLSDPVGALADDEDEE
jgi:addiction module RelE/StbE family toxin